MRLRSDTNFALAAKPLIAETRDMHHGKGSGMIFFEGDFIYASNQYVAVRRVFDQLFVLDPAEKSLKKRLIGKCVWWEDFGRLREPHSLSPDGSEMYDDDFEGEIMLRDSSDFKKYRDIVLGVMSEFHGGNAKAITTLPIRMEYLGLVAKALDISPDEPIELVGRGRDKPFGVKRHGSNLPEMGLMLAADVSPEDRDNGRQ